MHTSRYSVTDREKAAFSPQVDAVGKMETDDEGTPEWRARRIEEANSARARHGVSPLKTEPELHRRARDLGLLRPVNFREHLRAYRLL